MRVSDHLIYLFLFVVSFAIGCAHGMKHDIADQREATKEGTWHRAA